MLRGASPALMLIKISSVEIVSDLIDISVGVAEAGSRATGAGVCVAIGGTDVKVAEAERGVEKTSTEKLQALSSHVLNTNTIAGRDHFRCSIVVSPSVVGISSGEYL